MHACANKHFAKFLWKLYKGFIMMKLFAESKKTSSCGPFEMALTGCRHNIYIWTVSSNSFSYILLFWLVWGRNQVYCACCSAQKANKLLKYLAYWPNIHIYFGCRPDFIRFVFFMMSKVMRISSPNFGYLVCAILHIFDSEPERSWKRCFVLVRLICF